MQDDYLQRVLKARVYDVAIETPLDVAPRLSRQIGNTVWFKREDLQPVFSFKLRGAYNKIAHLSSDAARGVICASAGKPPRASRRRPPPRRARGHRDASDHTVDQGRRGTRPGREVAPRRHLRRRLRARCSLRERRPRLQHPFDDPDVIAGQGTIGMEILHQTGGEIDAIFVPVGGGGLIGGIAAYVKQLYPRIRIIGVEPEDAAAMYESLRAGKRVTLERVGIFADGVAVRRVGEETFELARRYVDEVVLVDTDHICAAIQDTFQDTRSIPEPSGALALAGLKLYAAREQLRDQRLVAINSGANMNFDRLRHIAERADIGGEREALLAVEIPERPGSFLQFCAALGARSVTEFNYRYHSGERARIFVGCALQHGRAEADALVRDLKGAGYPVLDLSDNELAKLHVRHLVGGQVPGLKDELLYRFEFPERPGALHAFLQAISGRWNISLFHYRNHGADYGRVLAGIQVPRSAREQLLQHLNELHYPYTEETANPAYRMFLGG
jgi:threonine dehydratase